MADRDANQEALDQVEEATESEPVEGSDLLESPELQDQLRKAKEREANRPTNGREDQRN